MGGAREQVKGRMPFAVRERSVGGARMAPPSGPARRTSRAPGLLRQRLAPVRRRPRLPLQRVCLIERTRCRRPVSESSAGVR